MVHDGVVLQQLLVDNTKGCEAFEFEYGFVSGHKIRDLDFVDSAKRFNEKDNDTDYKHRSESGPNGFGLISFNSMDEEDENTPSSDHKTRGVASVIAVFIEGKAVQTKGEEKSHCEDSKTLEPGKTFEMVVAYKLIPISHTTSTPPNWEDFVISADVADIKHWLSEDDKKFNPSAAVSDLKLTLLNPEEFKESPSATSDMSGTTAKGISNEGKDSISAQTDTVQDTGPGLMADLEYLAWRHLEYILSVCAIPFRVQKDTGGNDLLERFNGRLEQEIEFQNMPFVALTCGDMAGHRVVTSTS